MNLARDVKINKKGFYMYVNNKRKTLENVRLLLKTAGEQVKNYMEEVKVLSAFFT